jgi:hypothetical protein
MENRRRNLGEADRPFCYPGESGQGSRHARLWSLAIPVTRSSAIRKFKENGGSPPKVPLFVAYFPKHALYRLGMAISPPPKASSTVFVRAGLCAAPCAGSFSCNRRVPVHRGLSWPTQEWLAHRVTRSH